LTSNTTHVPDVRRKPHRNLVSSRNSGQTSPECGAALRVGLYRSLESELYCISEQVVQWINRYLLTSVLGICPTLFIILRLIAVMMISTQKYPENLKGTDDFKRYSSCLLTVWIGFFILRLGSYRRSLVQWRS
jgi:hypothetical protein